jgi:hypothetical protein
MRRLIFISILSGLFLTTQAQGSLKDWWAGVKNAAKQKKDSIIAAKKALAGGSTTPATAATPTATTPTVATAAKPSTPTAGTSTAAAGDTSHKGGFWKFLQNAQANSQTNTNGTANNLSTDAVTFVIDGCTGNSAAQTVTIFFTIANPVHVNQVVAVGGPNARAIDPEGNLSRPKELHLADGNGGWVEIPTGLKVKGSLTFANILAKEAQLALLEFTIFSHNSDGGRDPKTKPISVRNLNINWE